MQKVRVLVENDAAASYITLLSLQTWLVADIIDLITEYQVFLRRKGGAGDEASHIYTPFMYA